MRTYGGFLADGLAELVAPFAPLAAHTAALRMPTRPADPVAVTAVTEWRLSAPGGKAGNLRHAVPAGPPTLTAGVSACNRGVGRGTRTLDWRELPAANQCPDCHIAVLSAAPRR
jgi:hypothetical protein